MAIAIEVEDGTGKANANSFLSLADAEAFFEAYAFKADWTGTEETKTAALVQATGILESQFDWKGRRSQPDNQALQWPRTNVWEGDRYVRFNEIPKAIKNATALLAMAVLGNDSFMTRDPGQGGADQIAGINLGNGALQVDFQTQSTEGATSNRYKTLVSAEVLALLSPYGTFRQGGGMVRVARG